MMTMKSINGPFIEIVICTWGHNIFIACYLCTDPDWSVGTSDVNKEMLENKFN